MTEIDPDLYLAFENRFRGSTADISRKLEVYEPIVRALEHTAGQPAAVDLGCGQGEWLQYLQSRGGAVSGADQSGVMVHACQSQNLGAHQADAIEYLRTLKDSSIDLVSAFHVIEHLPFESVLDLCREAERVVKASGVVLFETPNPENIRVGTERFYLDPTHVRPLPPELMEFLMQWAGAKCCRAVRIHSEREYDPGHLLGQQMKTFINYSPDYALIATGNSQVMGAVELMSGDSGPSTARLYEALDGLHDSLLKTDQSLREHVDAMEAQISRLLARFDKQSHDLALLKHRSLGWRLAVLKHQVQRAISGFFEAFRSYPSQILEEALVRFAGVVRRHPKMKQVAVRVLRASPSLLAWLSRLLAPTATLTQLQTARSEDRYPLVTDLEIRLADAVTPTDTNHS